MLQAQFIPVEEFDQFVELPQNFDNHFEYIGGEAVQKQFNVYLSEIACEIGFQIKLYLLQNNMDAHVTGADGGYKIGGERYAPDVAYMPASKQAELDKSGYNSVPPDLAVEVVSSNSKDELDKLRIKITNYLFVGTTVRVVKPDDKVIEVHQPEHPVTIYRKDDTLYGGDILPDFHLKLSDIFKATE